MKFNKYKTFRWERIKGAEFEGYYDMPKLQPVHNLDPFGLVPFHLCKSVPDPEKHWFDFYEDDYQFERFWNKPSTYLPILKRFAGGISPDFSIYIDMPRSQQIWNCWRNRVMAYHLQQNGITVIPNVGWSDEKSLGWAFDGLPSNSILAITTQGCMGKDYYCKQSLLNGIHELVLQKHPEKLVVYGIFPDAWLERFPMPIVVFDTFSQEKWGKKNGKR